MNLFGYQIANYREEDTFLFRNGSGFPKTYALFGATWHRQAFPSLRPVLTSSNGQQRYLELINDTEQNPKKIKNIRVLTANISQLLQPFNWQKRQYNGQMASLVDYTVSQLSPDQYQTKVLDIPYNCLLLDINTFMLYEIAPFSIVTMTVRHDNGNLTDLLN
jgi:hypothetical protein